MFDKTFKAKVQVWVLKSQVSIYGLFQLMLITTVDIIYPGVETLLVVVFWLNLTIICYLLIPSKDTGFSHGWYFTVGF
jgi:hypothetical protein